VKRISTFVVLAAMLALVGSQQASAQTQTVTLVSDTSWEVFDGDPASGSATSLGFAQTVCLNASAPANCPGGATLYGYAGTGWTAGLSSIPGAVWIWAPGITGATAPAELAEFFFVKSIKITGAPTAGTIQVAVDDLAEIRVNGNIVGTTGSTTDSSLAAASANSLKSFDITPQLIKGVNTLTVRGQNGNGSFAACTNCTYSEHPAGIVLGALITFAPPCGGQPATIVGTSGDDFISGTKNDDVIDGLGGNDVIEGGRGDDCLIGGDGNDQLKGGLGADKHFGGAGNDSVRGGYGNDELKGKKGDDALKGGHGDDAMNGGADGDLCAGGHDTDTATQCEDVSGVP